MIAIIDYGAGNLQSVVKAMNYIGCKCEITKDINTILNADGAILPGVGSFEDAMNCMTSCSADKAVKEFVATGKPFLGICLGLQLLFPASEESPNAQGLSLLEGTVTKIPNNNGTLKIPHMGWNSLNIKKNDGLFKGIEGNPYVYFVHSYFAEISDATASSSDYGIEFTAAVSDGNVYGCQFHPEKSGDVGLNILRGFCEA